MPQLPQLALALGKGGQGNSMMRPFEMDSKRYTPAEARRRMFDREGAETLINSILAHRPGPDGKLEFLVDWFHFDDHCPTYQPASALVGSDVFSRYCDKYRLDPETC